MTEEEGERIIEAFEVTAEMQEFLDDGEDIKALDEARRLASHPNREVRMAALDAMMWIGGPAAADIALFFGDSDAEIAQEAEEAFWNALDDIDDPQVKISMLQISLDSPSTELQLEALDELLYLPGHLSFPVISTMLGNSDPDIRDLARENLEFISEEEFKTQADAMEWYAGHKEELRELWED